MGGVSITDWPNNAWWFWAVGGKLENAHTG